MIEEPAILTIKNRRARPTDEQISAFQSIPACVVSDALMGTGGLSATINHIDGGRVLPPTAAGPALTVDCGPADILAVMASLKFVQAGDLVIASFAEYKGCAVLGDRLIGMLKNNKAAGFVTDGPMRDFYGIVECGLPVWCTGLTPASPFSNGPGSVGFPIHIGGQRVETGDMIVADRDGVVVVPFARLDEIIERAAHIQNLEQAFDEKVAQGLKVSPKMEKLLASDKVQYID